MKRQRFLEIDETRLFPVKVGNTYVGNGRTFLILKQESKDIYKVVDLKTNKISDIHKAMLSFFLS